MRQFFSHSRQIVTKYHVFILSSRWIIHIYGLDMATNALSYHDFWNTSVTLKHLSATCRLTKMHHIYPRWFLIHQRMTKSLTRLLRHFKEIFCSKWKYDFDLLHHHMGLHVTHFPNVPYIYAELLFQKASPFQITHLHSYCRSRTAADTINKI
jgi:hypothetical protein